jgi:hypothetical protein
MPFPLGDHALQRRDLALRRERDDGATGEQRGVGEAVRRRLEEGAGGTGQQPRIGRAIVEDPDRGGAAGAVVARALLRLQQRDAQPLHREMRGGGGARHASADDDRVETLGAMRAWSRRAAGRASTGARRKTARPAGSADQATPVAPGSASFAASRSSASGARSRRTGRGRSAAPAARAGAGRASAGARGVGAAAPMVLIAHRAVHRHARGLGIHARRCRASAGWRRHRHPPAPRRPSRRGSSRPCASLLMRVEILGARGVQRGAGAVGRSSSARRR